MKRIIPALFFLAALLGLASCGNKKAKSDCGDGNGVCHIGDKNEIQLPSFFSRLA